MKALLTKRQNMICRSCVLSLKKPKQGSGLARVVSASPEARSPRDFSSTWEILSEVGAGPKELRQFGGLGLN